jgi:predicted negative regulator of RcsB-dependent stress response
LARILIAQEKAEQALPLLQFDNESGYFEVASMVKGDALFALGKKPEALEAYQAADNLGQATSSHPTLKLLIEELAAVDRVVEEAPAQESEVEESATEEPAETQEATE